MAASAQSLTTQSTAFTRDVLSRWVCNTLEEARNSADPARMRPDGHPQIEARDFDLIVVGGGTFGSILAEHMSFRDKARAHRILVLEAGPFALGEHVQNLPMMGLDAPKATNIAALRASNSFGPDKPMNEVWGLPWHSSVNFPGLAYCLGGRSLYWGGWSPELMTEELPTPTWPAQVVADLMAATLPDGSPSYFRQASEQIGVVETNDFIFGDLHRALRDQLFTALKGNKVTDAAAFAVWPDAAGYRYAATTPSLDEMRDMLGLPPTAAITEEDARNQLKLEAPLAVQGRAGHAGFFPFNKFSGVPLLVKAAREAFAESGSDDARKRVMVVPQCHVTRLRLVPDGGTWRVAGVQTNQGEIAVPANGKVVVALGTTHHETGTLAMGEASSTSVTLPDCRLRDMTNAYVAGPAAFPTIGSPNPMPTGVALVRRLGDQLAKSEAFVATDGSSVLFNGSDTSKWRITTIRNQGNGDPGRMRVINGMLETVAGNDMGIYWHTEPTPPNFILKLQWLRWSEDANSGVYLRFPDPDSKGYSNTAYVADDFGFEVQIDEFGDMPVHRTGAIYRKDNQTSGETLNQIAARPVGEWNDYEIHVQDQVYRVNLNGTEVCVFDNTMYPGRGLPSSNVAPSFIGLQVYANPRYQVAYRHIRIQAI